MPKSITFSESAINIPCFVEMLKQWDSYNWQVALNVSYLREREDGFPEFRLCPHCTFSMIRWWKWQKGGFESATWMKATPALYDSMNVEALPSAHTSLETFWNSSVPTRFSIDFAIELGDYKLPQEWGGLVQLNDWDYLFNSGVNKMTP